MQQQKPAHHQRTSSLASQLSLKSLDKSTYQYYRFLYQSQNHMLVRTTKFFGRKKFQWFRLNDTDLLLYSKRSSVDCKAVVPLDTIMFSDTQSILKGFTHCIKLDIPNRSAYWLHFKNENEKSFFVSLFAKEQKSPTVIPIFVNNQTFNPKDYQQYMNDPGVDEDQRNNVHKDDRGELDSPSGAYLRKESAEEENIITEIAQEGFIHVNQLKVYSDIYIKPRMTNIKETAFKRSFSNYKNLSLQFPSIEVTKSEFIPNVSSNAEGNPGYLKDSSALQFPFATPVSYSTKETQSRNSFKKISFSGEKAEEGRLTVNEKSGHQLNATGMPAFFVDTSVAGDDGEEVDQDLLGKGYENVNATRMMEFNGIVRRKTCVSPASRDGSYIKNLVFTEHDRKGEESQVQEEKTPASRVSSSRRREKVIGPRVMMNSVGPTIDKHEEDQEVEIASVKEELKEKEVLSKFFSADFNKKVAEFDEKSYLSLSLVDPRAENEQREKIETVEECIEMGHKLIWNFELEKARSCMEPFREKDPLVELLVIESAIVEIAVSGSEPKIKKVLEQLQDLLTKMNNVSTSQKEPEKYFSTELNKAEIYIYRGAMHFFLGNKFQTVKAFAEGWRHYRKLEHLLEKKPFKEGLSLRSLHRFSFGHGCFNLIFSLIPPGLLKFMKLIGIMNPSKEKGLESLERCRNENEVRSNYAAIALALYVIEFDVALERACDIVKDSLSLYGKCPLFHWIASIICWKFAQAKDACFMIKTALWQLKHNSEEAVYLIYELGWYHFVNMSWDKSLAIFLKIIVNALPLRFFNQQVSDVTALAKSLKLPLVIDFSKYQEDLDNLKEERNCILPHLPHIAVKIAVCNFYLGNYELAIKWLLSAIVIYRNYSNFKSRQEEDFSKLALKFLNRCSMKMLAYEVIYLMRYLPKMPDQNLFSMLEQVEEYQNSLSIRHSQLDIYLSTNSKEDPFIVEYFSATLIRIVNYCLLGDTDVACEIYRTNSKYMSLIPEDFGYLIVHIEYWIGRALISENRSEEARNMLKALLKRKKGDFSINTRIRRVLAEIH